MISAAPAALGYLYQVKYAMLVLWEGGPGSAIKLEALDDIQFDRDGRPVQLLQTKHHKESTAALTDTSSDLWKSIGNWATTKALVERGGSAPSRLLVTTATAPEGSAASLLRPQGSNPPRSPDRALELLEAACRASASQANRSAYKTFNALSVEERRVLLESIIILDASPSISDCSDRLDARIHEFTSQKHVEPLRQRLEGWWYRVAVERLASTADQAVRYEELNLAVIAFRDEFTLADLPLQFQDAPAPSSAQELPEDERLFVHQLRILEIIEGTVLAAIRDYYRAVQQRSVWVREGWLMPEKLVEYDHKLTEEWDRYFQRMGQDLAPSCADEDKRAAGRKLYHDVEDRPLIRVLPNVDAPFLTHGSRHILSNDLTIGWHPDYRQILAAIPHRRASP
jgi:hypothetical protein